MLESWAKQYGIANLWGGSYVVCYLRTSVTRSDGCFWSCNSYFPRLRGCFRRRGRTRRRGNCLTIRCCGYFRRYCRNRRPGDGKSRLSSWIPFAWRKGCCVAVWKKTTLGCINHYKAFDNSHQLMEWCSHPESELFPNKTSLMFP